MVVGWPAIERCSEVVRFTGVQTDEKVQELGHVQNRLSMISNLRAPLLRTALKQKGSL